MSPQQDDGIPTLTEVVAAPAPAPLNHADDFPELGALPGAPVATLKAVPADARADDFPELSTPPAATLVQAAAQIAQTAQAVSAASDARRRLEQELSSRVLGQLQGRVDLMLDARLRDALQQAVHDATVPLLADLRDGVQKALEDVVQHAVRQELAKLRSEKSKNS